jgi:hypothetical protein
MLATLLMLAGADVCGPPGERERAHLGKFTTRDLHASDLRVPYSTVTF